MTNINQTKTTTYKFGDYRLNTALVELQQGESVVKIQKRALELLTFLIENRSRTVTKEEIQDAVWAGLVVSETALTRAIMKARRAVGDSADQQDLIKTLHGQGYRFIAPVEEIASTLTTASVHSQADVQTEQQRRQRRSALFRAATTYAAGAWLLNQAAAMVWEAFEWQKLPLQALLAISLICFPLVLLITWFYQPTADGLKLRSERAAQPSTGSRRRDLLVIGMLGMALALSLAINFGSPRASLSHAQVAVLPVQNLTEDPTLEWINLGMLALLKSQLDSSNIPTVGVSKVLQHAGSEPRANDTLATDTALIDMLRKAEGATTIIHPRLERTSTGYRAAGTLLKGEQLTELPEFNGPTPSEAIRQLGDYIAQTIHPRVRSLGEAVATAQTGDPFKDQAFARGMFELQQGSLPQAKKLLEIAADGDAFWPNYELALTVSRLGDLDDASARYHALLDTARINEDPVQIVVLSNGLGIIQDLKGDLDAAKAHYEEGLTWAEKQNQPVRRAHLWINYAVLERARSNPQLAREYLGRAAAAYKDANIEILPGDFYITLGNLGADTGDVREAQSQYELALTTFRDLHQPKGQGIALSNLSWASEELGQWDQAESYLQESVAIRQTIGDGVGLVKSMVRQASLAYTRGKLDATEQVANAILEQPYAQQEKELAASAHTLLGQVARHRQQWPAAIAQFNTALTIEQAGGRIYGQLAARVGLMKTHLNAQQFELARTLAQNLVDDPMAAELVSFKFEAQGELAKLLIAEQKTQAAADLLRETIRQADRSGAEGIRVLLCIDLAEIYLSSGNLAEAEGWIGSASNSAPNNGRVLLATAALEFAKGNLKKAKVLVAEAKVIQGQRITPRADALLARFTAK